MKPKMITFEGKRWRRVNLTEAETHFMLGGDVVINPVKLNPEDEWGLALLVNEETHKEYDWTWCDYELTLEAIFAWWCLTWKKYYCNRNNGRYLAYYI